MSLRIVLAVSSVSLVLVLSGCSKPKEGGSCTGEQGSCIDKQNALVCIGGTFAKVKCRKNAVGCMEVMGNVSCDVERDVGVPCAGDKEADCSSDGKKMLDCTDGKWALRMNCSKLCVSNVNGVRCENAEGAAGDPCTQEQFDSAVCSADKKMLLVCDGKSFFAASTCKGQNHCRAVGKMIECDTSLADIDDPCEKEGELSCDTAKKVMLKCTNKKFVKEQACKKRCNNAFQKFSCD
ncbi:MAG: hypothetical protein JNM17_17450 [Archangium sp.]|nr:hypothetical protein [Archangium sp.]